MAEPGVLCDIPVPSECEVLVRAAPIMTPRAAERIDALTRGPFDWERCRALARRHGVTPLLVRALSGCGARRCPPDVWNAMRQECRTTAVRNLSRTGELLSIIEDLRDVGITALAVKGPVAGIVLYGDVSLRPFNDLDLLIDRGDLNGAIERLAARGYRPRFELDAAGWRRYVRRYNELTCVQPETGIAVDLHWALLNSRYFGAPLAGCRERAVTLHIGTRQLATLCAEDTLVFSLLHVAKHGWSLLGWFIDLALLLDTRSAWDWRRHLIQVAATVPGSRLPMGVGLRIVESLFGVPDRGLVEELTARDRRAGKLARQACAILMSPKVTAASKLPWPWAKPRLRSMAGTRHRLRYVYDIIFSSTPLEWTAVRLPAWLAWSYSMLRWARLTTKYTGRTASRRFSHRRGDSSSS